MKVRARVLTLRQAGNGIKETKYHIAARRKPIKFYFLENAVNLEDLRMPPGNHLEVLHGDRRGQHSIRINNRYRICFVWFEKGPKQVEIVGYH